MKSGDKIGSNEIKYHEQFDMGYKKGFDSMNSKETGSVYGKALDMSNKSPQSLSAEDKGFVVGAANKMITYKNKALDAARLYENVGAIDNEGVKSEIIDGLARDLARTHGVKKKGSTEYLNYRDQVEGFMDRNDMGNLKGINLEHAIVKAERKRMNVLPFVFVALGVAFSSFRITGNVIGAPDLDNFLGVGFFTAGLIWLVTSIKKTRPKSI